MLNHMRYRIVILTLIAGIACLSVGPIPASLGQGQDHKRPVDRKSVRVFGSGGADRTLGGGKSPAPAPLDESFKIEIARQAGSTLGSPLLKLTPKAPSVANRGALVFVNPALVEGGEDYVFFEEATTSNGLPPGILYIWLKPIAGKKYLIDCTVSSPSKDGAFSVEGPDGTAAMIVGAIAGGQHLTFVLYATNDKWQSFRVSHLSTTLLPAFFKWTFYSCEVTNL